MTTDDFTEAARAEAERRYIESDPDYPDRDTAIARAAAFAVGAVWGHDQALAQEPTNAEVEAAARVIYRDAERRENYYTSAHREAWENVARAALTAARKAR